MKSAQLFLSGGGSLETSFRFDEKFFSALRLGAKILYIPVAMRPEKFPSCHKWFSELLARHGRGMDVSFTMLTTGAPIPTLENFDAIYIGGGNTYRLLDYVHAHGLTAKLREYLVARGVIYGGSAGAIIFGRDIRTAASEKENFTRDDGIGLFNFCLDCHYETSMDMLLFETSRKIGAPILALSEPSGLIADASGNIFEIIGEVFWLAEGKKRMVGSTADIPT